jgi:glycine/D-amino acid oxidase-like deaminating enzyme
MSTIPGLDTAERRSFWQATMPALPDRRGLDLPDTADVVVIGGGYTGLGAARRAAELGATTVLLEAEHLGWGASTRNAGMAHPGFNVAPRELVKRFGETQGRRMFAETLAAFEDLATLCTTRIDADFVRSGHLELAFAPGHVEELEASVADLASVDVPAHFVPRERLREEIGTDAYFGALAIERSGGVHPGKLLAGMVTLAEEAGAELREGVAVTGIRPQADGRFVVETSAGAILARNVIAGTNGYTGGATPSLRRRVLSIGSYIIATDPLPDDVAAEVSPKGRMFFDTKHFLYYWRLTPDNRMLFGGRASMWPTTVDRTSEILYRAMVEVHPQLEGTRVAYAWGGRVGFTLDRLPHAGRADGVTYGMGCCGTGVALFPWLGARLAEWAGGGEAPALAAVRFPLVPAPYEGKAWFMPLAGEWWKLQDRLAARSRARAGVPGADRRLPGS